MVSARIWSVINISLVLVAFVLFLNLLETDVPTVGAALFQLDDNDAICISAYGNQQSLLNIDFCCPELQQQLVKGEKVNTNFLLDGEQFAVQKRYYTGENTIDYFINMKGYRYCKNNGFLV